MLAVAVAAGGILLVTTHRFGLGVTYDSVVYTQASHSLSSIPLPQPRDDGGKALYWWGPVYPVVLETFGGTYSGARILSALLLVLGALVVGGVAWRIITPGAGVAAAALYSFSPAVYSAHLNLLAEPLFLVLAVLAIAAISDRRPILGGLVTGAAVLTRYAGLPLIVLGAIVLRGRDRVRFLAVSIATYGAWLLRNELAAGQTTGRELRWHPPSWGVVGSGARVLAHLVVTTGSLPSIPFSRAGLLVQLAVAGALAVAVTRAGRTKPPRLVVVCLLYSGLYCAFLAVTISLFDAETPVNDRLLVPLVPAIVLGIAWLLREQPMLAAVPICAFALATLQLSRTVSLYGIDYSGVIWSSARIDAGSLPPGPLYSNWPAAVAYFTGRSPRRLPSRRDPHTLAPNPGYELRMATLARAVRAGRASLVILDDSFLEIRTSGRPITESPGLKHTCRPLTKVVTLCAASPRHTR